MTTTARESFTVTYDIPGIVGDCDGGCGTHGNLTSVIWKKRPTSWGALLSLCRSCCIEAEQYTIAG